MAAVQDLYARRVLQKYRLRPDEWDYTLPQITQLLNETPWTKVETAGIVNLKEEDGDDVVRIGNWHATIHAQLDLVSGHGSKASPTALIADDELGEINFKGQYTTAVDDYATGAQLIAKAESAWKGGTAIGWSKLGGDGQDSSWTGSSFFAVWDIVEMANGDVYAAIGGNGSGAGELWRLSGGTWEKVGGDGVNSSWAASGDQEAAMCMCTDGTYIYVGIGAFSEASGGTQGEVWQLDPSDDSWTEIYDGDALGGVIIFTRAHYIGGRVYFAGQGTTRGRLIYYNGTPDSWTTAAISNGTSLPNGLRGVYDFCVDVAGTKMYIATGDQAGDGEVWEATVDTWSWSQIGGDSTNSSWSLNDVVTALVRDPNGEDLYALAWDPGTSDQEVWKYDEGTTTWSQVGGDALNSGWDGAANARATEFHWGGLAVDGSYIYAGISATLNGGENGVWRRLHTGGNWEQIGGNALNSGWDDAQAQAIGWLYLGPTGLYAGIGDNTTSGAAELWFTGLGANRSAYVELYVTQPDDTALTLTQKWYSNLDVAIGNNGGALNGIFWDDSATSVGILTTTPARTLHIAGTDGMRLAPSAEPSSLTAGDFYIDSGDNNDAKWYDGSAIRPIVSGPTSAVTDENIAVFDGTTGHKIKDGGTAAALVAGAGGYVPVTTTLGDDKLLVFAGNDLLMAFDATP